MDPVAQRIADLIEEKGYSRSGFAEAVGVQRTIVSHVLSGRNRPSLDLVVRILRAFPELEPSVFILGEERATEKDRGEMASEEEPKKDGNEESGQKELPLAESLEDDEKEQGSAAARDEDPPPYRKPGNRDRNKEVERVVICYSDGSFASYEADL